jgi:adenosine deaminase
VKNPDHREWLAFLASMPKVELHLHLEGAFTLETFLRLVRRRGGEPGIDTVDDLRRRFAYKDFPHFIETWNWKNAFFTDRRDFALSAHETLLALHAQGVMYVEAFFSPWDFAANALTMEEIADSTIEGCRQAERECGIRWGLIADLDRNHGPAEGLRRIDQIASYRGRGIIGVGLGGSEDLFPAAPFAEAFEEAARRGLWRTAHAGEAAGASSIRDVVALLNVQRIGHGVRAMDDPAVYGMIRERAIPLEMCITSNVCTGVVPDVHHHPFRRFLEDGATVTLNTDDPTMFGCTLTSEYALLLGALGCSPLQIRQAGVNAIEAAFLSEAEKAALRERYAAAWRTMNM